jgi:hypothetical protein
VASYLLQMRAGTSQKLLQQLEQTESLTGTLGLDFNQSQSACLTTDSGKTHKRALFA